MKKKKIDLRKESDMKLMFYLQDVNRNEQAYTPEFIKAVNDEVCRRGEESPTHNKRPEPIKIKEAI